MQLLYSPASPFARKARVTAIESGLATAIGLVEVHTTAVETDPQVARANPLGKIPTLIRDEGPALYDSRVICRYLAQKGSRNLYPESRLWEVLTLEATADGMMDAAVLVVYEARFRAEASRHQGWVDGQRARLARSLDALEGRWMSHLGGPLTAGQIGVGCALGYLDFRLPDLDWRQEHPELAAWLATFSERASMVETAPPRG